MSKRNAFVILFAMATATLILRAQSPDLPPGPLQAKARTACMECHDAGIIVQQRLDRNTWSKEVDKMIRWGATVQPQDRDAFVDYFAINFGTDKPPQSPQYTKPHTKTRAAASKR
jgi:hypothetical protein